MGDYIMSCSTCEEKRRKRRKEFLKRQRQPRQTVPNSKEYAEAVERIKNGK